MGYVDQNIRRQLDGIELDRFFVDKASGKNTARPKFQEMLSYVHEGDMIVVHSMDRFARSLKDLVTEVDQLVKRGVAIQFVKENILLLDPIIFREISVVVEQGKGSEIKVNRLQQGGKIYRLGYHGSEVEYHTTFVRKVLKRLNISLSEWSCAIKEY
nr:MULTISPECIES: recombinase family protein [unclassified Acinetobacter]